MDRLCNCVVILRVFCFVSGVVVDVRSEVAAWEGREVEEGGRRRGYFGVRTEERVIEFECRSRQEQHKWVQGITEMLNRRDNLNMNITHLVH